MGDSVRVTPAEAATLGGMLGADAVVTGTVAVTGGTVEVHDGAGEVVAAETAPTADARRWTMVFDAPLVEFAASELIVDRQAQVVNLQYRRRAAEDFVLLVIAEDAGLTGISIEGRSVPVTAWDGFVTVAVFAPGDGVIRFELRFDHEAPVNAWLVDGGNRLPLPNHKLILARGELAVPQHRGDQRLAYRRVTF